MSVRIETQAEPIPGYRLLDRLGSGGFGEVWRCEAPGGIFKAIKIIHGDLRERETDSFRFAEQELKALKRVQQVRHPYLLALDRYDIVDGKLLITMELADCNLWDRFRVCRKAGHPGIPRDELLRYMAETAEVLDLFNDKFQLQHLDIKPQNLFLLYDHVKVADFGQVKDLQGIMAQVTGGITPVYAAPETFDGFVSRFCDQYSLACVYQELLTGQRPFDGSSMQQLLMQHLQMAPNLAPSPPCDRPALAVALAKRPEDRFPSVGAFVKALAAGGELPRPGSGAVGTRPADPDAAASGRIDVSLGGPGAGSAVTGLPSRWANSLTTAGGGPAAETNTPGPRFAADTAPPLARPAPVPRSGPGCLRPALIIGVGYTGLRVLQRFRHQLGERFGPADRTPAVRTLYIDTDPDALAAATTGDLGWAGLSALPPEDVFPAKLNRAAHYLKPRLSGRTILDGWFDPQMLYKMPRNPVTLGYRALGRLAFCDHYRVLLPKLQAELEACLAPDALAATEAATGLTLRTNRPRVYVVAGLGGGTGGGMFLDLAYAVRGRLRRLGYLDPDVVGVLLPPAGAAGDVSAQAQANTYAALTELHHYARPGTAFAATYDERAAAVRDADAPFSQVYIAPGLACPEPRSPGSGAVPAAAASRNRSPADIRPPGPRDSGSIRLAARRPGSGPARPTDQTPPGRRSADPADPTAAAAVALRLHLFTQAGPLADAARPDPVAAADGTPRPPAHTFGAAGLTWPRAEVVGRTGRVLAPVLVGHWVSPDPAQVRQVIPAWAADQWAAAGLDPDALMTRLTDAAGRAVGVDVAAVVAAGTDRLTPAGGWRAKTPDPEVVAGVVDHWQQLLGRPAGPTGVAAARSAGRLADPITAAADDLFGAVRADLGALFPALIETPHFRLAGTEEAIRQVISLIDRARAKCDQTAAAEAAAATAALDQLVAYGHHHKGHRKPAAGEFADAVRTYPAGQLKQLGARAAGRVYRKLKDVLVALLAEVTGCRQRVEVCLPDLAAAADAPAPPAAPAELLPPGCATTEDAAQAFLRSLTDDDLTDLDGAVQDGLERRFGGLYQACLNSTDGPAGLLAVIREQTRHFLDRRLGEVDMAAMLFARFGGPEGTAAELARVYAAAEPTLLGSGPWTQTGLTVYAGPAGAGGDPVRAVAADVLPAAAHDAPAADEVTVYREYPDIPLAALPQFGPQWAAAYRAYPDTQQTTAHARLDITRWADIDSA